MSSSSRFNRLPTNTPDTDRSPAADVVSPPSSAEQAQHGGQHAHPADDAALKSLQERLNRVQERRLRRKIDLENARRERDECEREAKKLGVCSLEELEQRVVALQQQDAEALAAFVAALDQEEKKLDEIENRLQALDKSE